MQDKKLWLWKNFVDGKPEYWAFDNPYPTRLDCGDPQTLGEPCGYAIFKPSRDGSNGRTEEQVLKAIARVRERTSLPHPAEHRALLECAAAFERSADWLDHGSLRGSHRTHPLVGTHDYRIAAMALRKLVAAARDGGQE